MVASLSPEQVRLQEDILSGLDEHAQPHIAQNNRLMLLDHDPQQYSAQALSRYCVFERSIAPTEQVDVLGRLVMENYYAIAADLQDGEQGEYLREAGEIMEDGGTVVLATSHENLIDPGVVLGTVANALREQDYEFESGIMLFKMLSVLQYKFTPDMDPLPCIEVLRSFCHRTYVTFPRSDSVRESGLMERNADIPDHVADLNARAKRSVKRWEARGGAMIAQAPSASTHRWSEGRTECVVPRVTYGTSQFMAHPNARVLPVIFDLGEDQQGSLEIFDRPRRLKAPEDAHELMEDMAVALNARSSAAGQGEPYMYQEATR